MEFETYPTGWHIEGNLPNQVAVSTGSMDCALIARSKIIIIPVTFWVTSNTHTPGTPTFECAGKSNTASVLENG